MCTNTAIVSVISARTKKEICIYIGKRIPGLYMTSEVYGTIVYGQHILYHYIEITSQMLLTVEKNFVTNLWLGNVQAGSIHMTLMYGQPFHINVL